MKRPDVQKMNQMKEALYEGLARGDVDIRRATLEMRKILGMSQKEYAKTIARVSPRILSAFENGTGNPTLATLEKIAKPFGLKVTFLPPETWRMAAPKDE